MNQNKNRLQHPTNEKPNYKMRQIFALSAFAITSALGIKLAEAGYHAVRGPEPISEPSKDDPKRATYIVQPGDQPWDIARHIEGDTAKDIRPLVYSIVKQEKNGNLQIGQDIHYSRDLDHNLNSNHSFQNSSTQPIPHNK
ncbi:MAG: hypothetical protein NVSMB46_09290 [Candidatus Saccharimonadales bacterium]